MSITIELTPEVEAGLKAKAEQMGITVDELVQDALCGVAADRRHPPLWGLLSKYNLSLSAEEIDKNRRDMTSGTIFERHE